MINLPDDLPPKTPEDDPPGSFAVWTVIGLGLILGYVVFLLLIPHAP